MWKMAQTIQYNFNVKKLPLEKNNGFVISFRPILLIKVYNKILYMSLVEGQALKC